MRPKISYRILENHVPLEECWGRKKTGEVFFLKGECGVDCGGFDIVFDLKAIRKMEKTLMEGKLASKPWGR